MDLQSFIAILLENNVGILLDVREVAWSYKPGFSKTALREGLEKSGIDYVHVRSAGNPKSNRRTAKSIEECLSRYRTHLRDNDECLDEIFVHIKDAFLLGRPACLTCFEYLPGECHRSVIIEELIQRNVKLSPVHLFGHDGVH